MDEILNLIESVSEVFSSYSCFNDFLKNCENKRSRSLFDF